MAHLLCPPELFRLKALSLEEDGRSDSTIMRYLRSLQINLLNSQSPIHLDLLKGDLTMLLCDPDSSPSVKRVLDSLQLLFRIEESGE